MNQISPEEVVGIVRAVMEQNPTLIPAPVTPEPARFAYTLDTRVTGDEGPLAKLAEGINQTGKTLKVLGVTASMSQDSSPADLVDFRIDGTTALTGTISLTTKGVAVAGALSGTPTIAPGGRFQLYLDTNWTNHDVCMIITVEVQ